MTERDKAHGRWTASVADGDGDNTIEIAIDLSRARLTFDQADRLVGACAVSCVTQISRLVPDPTTILAWFVTVHDNRGEVQSQGPASSYPWQSSVAVLGTEILDGDMRARINALETKYEVDLFRRQGLWPTDMAFADLWGRLKAEGKTIEQMVREWKEYEIVGQGNELDKDVLALRDASISAVQRLMVERNWVEDRKSNERKRRRGNCYAASESMP